MKITGPEAWRQRLKAEKEREKAVKTKTTELHHNFRAKEISQDDVKLKAMKEEERRKAKETAEMLRQFKRLEMGQDEMKLAEFRVMERRRVQETERMLHTHQNNTIQESDMKLSLMRQEERKRLQEHERMMRKVNHTPGFVQMNERPGLRRSSSYDNLGRSTHSGHTNGDDEQDVLSDGTSTALAATDTAEATPEDRSMMEQQPTKKPVMSRRFRRSSISTDFSGNWRASSAIQPHQEEAKAPESEAPPTPASESPAPVAKPSGTTGQRRRSSIQNALSVFSKGNSVPQPPPAYGRSDSNASSQGGTNAQPAAPPAPTPVAEPVDTTGQTTTTPSSVQNARSVFAKGGNSTTPRPAFVRADSNASSVVENIDAAGHASLSSLRSHGSRGRSQPSRPLYGRMDDDDSSSSESGDGSLVADPLGLGNSRNHLETPDPSEAVDEVSEQPLTVETKATNMKDAFNIFNKGGKEAGSAPLLPPKHNSYVSAKSTSNKSPSSDEKFDQSPEEEEKKAERPLLVKAMLDDIPREEEKTPEEIEGDALLSTPATVVRLDVLFSFGLLTASNEPVFTNYMTAVETIVKRTVEKNTMLAEYVWYDPVYPPFVQDYKIDGTWCMGTAE